MATLTEIFFQKVTLQTIRLIANDVARCELVVLIDHEQLELLGARFGRYGATNRVVVSTSNRSPSITRTDQNSWSDRDENYSANATPQNFFTFSQIQIQILQFSLCRCRLNCSKLGKQSVLSMLARGIFPLFVVTSLH
jgi:hypothetical protein